MVGVELQDLNKASKIKGLQEASNQYLQIKLNIAHMSRPNKTMGGFCV